MPAKFVDVLIKKDGTVEVDQQGYTGKECVNDIADLIGSLGVDKKVDNKAEYYRQQRVEIRQANE